MSLYESVPFPISSWVIDNVIIYDPNPQSRTNILITITAHFMHLLNNNAVLFQDISLYIQKLLSLYNGLNFAVNRWRLLLWFIDKVAFVFLSAATGPVGIFFGTVTLVHKPPSCTESQFVLVCYRRASKSGKLFGAISNILLVSARRLHSHNRQEKNVQSFKVEPKLSLDVF